MGHLVVAVEQYALGMRLLACAEAMRVSIGMSFKPLGSPEIARDRLTCEQALGEGEAAANWLVGTSADPEGLFAEAQLSLAVLLS